MELGGKRYEISDDTIPEQPRVKTKKAERDRQTDRQSDRKTGVCRGKTERERSTIKARIKDGDVDQDKLTILHVDH